ncbi:MAG TPA: lipid II flippase MurJ [Micromonosporaceae bacterium]
MPGDRTSVGLARSALRHPSWLVGLAVALIAVPVGTSAESASAAHVTPPDIAEALLVGLIGVQVVRRRVAPPRPAAWMLATAMVASGALTAFTAVDQVAAVLGWVRFAQVFVLVPIATALALRTRSDLLRILVPLVAVGALEAALAVWQHLTDTGAAYGSTHARSIGTFGAYDIMGLPTLLGCLLIVLTAEAATLRGRARWAALGGAVALVVPLAFSYSRGGWIGTALGAVAVLVAAGWRRAVLVLGTLAMMGTLALATGVVAAGPLGERFASIGSVVSDPDASVRDRYGLWTAAGAMWRDHPLTGVGIKNFAEHRDRYLPVDASSTSDIGDLAGGFRRVELLSPHNLYLLVLSEQGLLGALAFGGALVALGAATVRRLYRDAPGAPERVVGVAALGLLTWFLTTSLYGEPSGPDTALVSALLGVAAWWALGRRYPTAAGDPTAHPEPAPQPPAPPQPARQEPAPQQSTPQRPARQEPARRGPAPTAPVTAALAVRPSARLTALMRGRSGVAIGVATLMICASVLGLVRDLAIARLFGASARTDAFLVAWSIPETATPLLVDGVMGLFLVPLMARALRDGTLRATVARTLPTVVAVLSVLTVVLVVGADWFVHLLAPGLAEPHVAVGCFRIGAVSVLWLGVAGYLMAVLKANSSFLVPASANIAWNVGIIASMAALSGSIGIYGAATGLAVGGLTMALVQGVAAVRRVGLPRLRLAGSSALLNRWAIVMPVTVYALTRQGQTYTERYFGSQLGPGAISHLNYAFKVAQIAVTVSVAAGWVSFPAMARAALTERGGELAARLQHELRIAVTLLAPQVAALLAFAPQAVAVLFGHGRFSAADTDATVVILRVVAAGLLGQTVVVICGWFLFAANNRDRSPAVATGIGLLVTVLGDAFGYRIAGAPGIAAGNAVGLLVAGGLLLRSVRRKRIPLNLNTLARLVAGCALAAVAGATTALGVVHALPGTGSDLLDLTVGSTTLLVVYVGVLYAARRPLFPDTHARSS